MNYDVRKAVPEDAKEMSEVIYDYYGKLENELLFLQHYQADKLKERLEKLQEYGYIAIKENKIIGLLCYIDAGFHINMTEVLLKRGMNYGAVVSSLVKIAFEALKPNEGFRKIIASTKHYNEQSMIMLIKMGFIPEATIRHGYCKNVHQIVWSLYLGDKGFDEDLRWL